MSTQVRYPELSLNLERGLWRDRGKCAGLSLTGSISLFYFDIGARKMTPPKNDFRGDNNSSRPLLNFDVSPGFVFLPVHLPIVPVRDVPSVRRIYPVYFWKMGGISPIGRRGTCVAFILWGIVRIPHIGIIPTVSDYLSISPYMEITRLYTP